MDEVYGTHPTCKNEELVKLTPRNDLNRQLY